MTTLISKLSMELTKHPEYLGVTLIKYSQETSWPEVVGWIDYPFLYFSLIANFLAFSPTYPSPALHYGNLISEITSMIDFVSLLLEVRVTFFISLQETESKSRLHLKLSTSQTTMLSSPLV